MLQPPTQAIIPGLVILNAAKGVPPIDDDPPIQAYALSVGCMLGVLLESGKLSPSMAHQALNYLTRAETAQEMHDLIVLQG